MKGRHICAACMMLIAGVLFGAPGGVHAEEKPQSESVDYGYTEIIQDVLSSDNPAQTLGSLDEEKRGALKECLTEEERKQFCAIYRYLLLTEAAQPNKDAGITKEILDAEITFYKNLTDKERVSDSDMGVLEQQAFDTFKAEMIKKDAEWERKTEEASGYDAYLEYLQTQTTADMKGLAEKLSGMDTVDDMAQEKLYEELRVLLYQIHGIECEQEQMPEQESAEASSIEAPEETAKKARNASMTRSAAVARVGGNYYTTFDEAFYSMPDGGTLYVLRDCTATHLETKKSFAIYPEGQNVRITFRETSPDDAGIICTPDGWYGRPTWTLGGNGDCTLTLDANGRGGSGVLAAYGATINLKEGVRLTNSAGNGVWNHAGITNVYENVKIYNNGSHGIASFNTINMYGGEIYGNAYDGIRAEKVINLSGGSLHDNGECGVHPGDGACTFTMTGGSSFHNRYGVGAYIGETSMYIQGGDIYENAQYGVMFPGRVLKLLGSASIRGNGESGIMMSGGETYVEGGNITSNGSRGQGGGICVYGGKLCLAGGTIAGNAASKGNGVYFNGTVFEMRGFGAVDEGNDVYLAQNKYITVTDTLQSSIAAKLTFADYWIGRKAAEVVYGEQKASMQCGKFTMTANGSYCLRPGDYQDREAQTKKENIVLSTGYQIFYEKNIAWDVTNVPGAAVKYWYEGLSVSSAVPKAGTIRFLGWSENAESQTAQYQPGETIPAAQNRNTTLYALWGPQLRIVYCGNGNDKGAEKAELITARGCALTGGYIIQKNTGFTAYERNGYKLTGWDIKKDVSSKETKYQETQNYTVSFEELLSIAASQSGGALPPQTEIAEVRLYAVWDAEPVITAEGIQEFYEGTEVTGEMLLQNVRAADKEDGEITKNISIAGIEYSEGKWDGREKRETYAENWNGQIPTTVRLDTWFNQLQEEDSPVEHNVIYQVSDSAGNQVLLKWPVRVKFNEYPKIEAPDRYFTLEEAQNGSITEDVLLAQALAEEKLKVTDSEDDRLFPGRIKENIKLIDFHPEEFKSFNESGYVTVTYTVQDSMGPDKKGKETFRQCTLYIVKDGEVEKSDPVTYVRFVNKKYYEKNINIKTSNKKDTNTPDTKNGGLLPTSKWYQNSAYKEVLSDVWSNNQNMAERWDVEAKDVTAIKSYVDQHGIGNSKEQTALDEFLRQFSYLQN